MGKLGIDREAGTGVRLQSGFLHRYGCVLACDLPRCFCQPHLFPADASTGWPPHKVAAASCPPHPRVSAHGLSSPPPGRLHSYRLCQSPDRPASPLPSFAASTAALLQPARRLNSVVKPPHAWPHPPRRATFAALVICFYSHDQAKKQTATRVHHGASYINKNIYECGQTNHDWKKDLDCGTKLNYTAETVAAGACFPSTSHSCHAVSARREWPPPPASRPHLAAFVSASVLSRHCLAAAATESRLCCKSLAPFCYVRAPPPSLPVARPSTGVCFGRAATGVSASVARASSRCRPDQKIIDTYET